MRDLRGSRDAWRNEERLSDYLERLYRTPADLKAAQAPATGRTWLQLIEPTADTVRPRGRRASCPPPVP